jgi:hypothetical protein
MKAMNEIVNQAKYSRKMTLSGIPAVPIRKLFVCEAPLLSPAIRGAEPEAAQLDGEPASVP